MRHRALHIKKLEEILNVQYAEDLNDTCILIHVDYLDENMHMDSLNKTEDHRPGEIFLTDDMLN